MKHTHALTAFGLVLTFTTGCAFSDFHHRYTVDEILSAGIDRIEVANPGGAALYPNFESDWYNHSVSSPTVDFDGQTYRMWFPGISMADEKGVPYGFAERVGLATSKDGRRWTVANDGQPVLPWGEPGRFDDKGIAHPFVLRVGGRFMMWYGGIDGRLAKDIGQAPGHVRIEQIGLAISEDGVHWEKANGGEPVLKIGPKGSIDTIQATGCHVIRRGDEFVMWYGAYNGLHTIGLATSPDGIEWTKQNDGRSLPGLAWRASSSSARPSTLMAAVT